MSLFADTVEPAGDDRLRPLADRMRPRTFAELAGQDEAFGETTALRRAVEAGRAGSLILWGPPGVGKTTVAHLIARESGMLFEPFSAVLSGVKEVRAAIDRAHAARDRGRGTLLFVDEIHRFNKAQQDAFLPAVESGLVALVGATTENPAFSVIRALLSRCRVVRLTPLTDEAVGGVVDRALRDPERGLGRRELAIDADARELLCSLAAGDARRALTVLEAAAGVVDDGSPLTRADIASAFGQRTLAHDKSGDHHFDLLSALHKSLRNSDPQAAVYWLARMLEAGVDPMQPARRMIAMAAEDIGLADPLALQIATAAQAALHVLGLPEGRLPLAEAAIYLASAPKSNAVIRALDAATEEVRRGRQWPVPPHLCNAPTELHRELGHGEGYRYAHDAPGGVAAMPCLPDALRGSAFYRPGEWGFEAKMRQRLADIERRRAER